MTKGEEKKLNVLVNTLCMTDSKIVVLVKNWNWESKSKNNMPNLYISEDNIYMRSKS